MLRSPFRRALAAAAAAVLPATALVFAGGSANAITGGPSPSSEVTLPAVAGNTFWQVNDVHANDSVAPGGVWALAYGNGVLWVGGDFTYIRPPGAAPGTSQTAMKGLAAFHTNGTPCTTGNPCNGIGGWNNPNLGKVSALNITPDGTRLFAGGDFGAVEYNLTTGQKVAWSPGVKSIRAIASTNTQVFLGGAFTSPTQHVAAFAVAGGARQPGFAPSINGTVNALLVAPGSSRLIIGGGFSSVDGAARTNLAQVDLATGTINGPMATSIASTPTGTAAVKALVTDGSKVYVGSEGTGPGAFDGQAAFNPSTGAQAWKTNCYGATQALAVIRSALYIGSHMHNCTPAWASSFPQDPFNNGEQSWHHLEAENTGNGTLLNWWPTTNSGPTNARKANELGPRAMATDGTGTVWVGGQFTQVNGVNQEGLTGFTASGNGAPPTAPVVTAISSAPGKATVRWTSSSDPDDATLSYTVRRNGVVVNTLNAQDSPWWRNKAYVFRDASAGSGSVSYTVTATDANNLPATGTANVTVGSSPTYQAAVTASGPASYWRLDDASGTTATSVVGPAGTYSGTYARNTTGAIDGDAAVGQSTATSKIFQQKALSAAPANFSLEMWFRGTGSGGRLIGWSSSTTGTSPSTNRALYVNDYGQVMYGSLTSDGSSCDTAAATSHYMVTGVCYLWSKQDYNDGGWHHVVVTQSSTDGMRLYVDGVLVGSNSEASAKSLKAMTGLWRVGADTTARMQYSPGTKAFPGDIDEVATYSRALTATDVANHYRAAQ